jgi:hypothetical protein
MEFERYYTRDGAGVLGKQRAVRNKVLQFHRIAVGTVLPVRRHYRYNRPILIYRPTFYSLHPTNWAV